MSKICSSCHYAAGDNEVFCPACGTYLETPNANPSGYARPMNQAGSPPPIATPLHLQQNHPDARADYPQPVPAQKSGRGAGRLPFIVIGVAAAALIFVVALIVVMNSRDAKHKNNVVTPSVTETQSTVEELAGSYQWLNGSEDQVGTLVINQNNIGVFTLEGSGSVTITFDPEKKSASYPDATGEIQTGSYTFSDGMLAITVDGYTDLFKKN